eukprot:5795868-Prymnesium_polylepis.1
MMSTGASSKAELPLCWTLTTMPVTAPPSAARTSSAAANAGGRSLVGFWSADSTVTFTGSRGP